MKKITTILSLTVLLTVQANIIQGQSNAMRIGKISGQIIDAVSGSPMEYATVAIFQEKDSSLVTGTITEPNGNFKITDVPVGKFYLRIDFLGYKTLTKSDINITFDNPEIKLRKITIEPYESVLEGVNIVAERPLYQNQIDRRIINPEQDVMAAGGSALNVLENAPSVDVDIDGNIALRGNSSVSILIDGRPSGYSGESAGDLLQQIPANSIDKIEVITNPSSKYDPEGVTGIINIVMKKNSVRGFNGTVNAGIGTMLDYNVGANLNYRNDRMSLYSNIGVNNRKRESANSMYKETYYNSDTTVFDQNSKNKSSGLSIDARLGLDFFINSKNTFSITGRMGGGPRNGDQLTSYRNYSRKDGENNIYQRYKTDVNEDRTRFSYNIGAQWEKKFIKKDHFLLFDASFGKRDNKETSFYDQYLYYHIDREDSLYLSYSKQDITKGFTQDFEGKIDYAMPVGINSKLEAGGAVRLRKIDNDLKIGYKREGYYENDPTQSNRFIYDEDIYALYAQFGSKINKFSYQVGLRGEYATTQGENPLRDDSLNFSSNYFQVYPTAYVMYQIKEFDELKLNYTRRVNRPGPWNLNPYQSVTDSMNRRIGNPSLKPEYVNSVELGYFHYMKSGTLSATLYYRNTTDVISRITEIDPITMGSISTWKNLNTTNSYGLEFVFNDRFFEIWSLTASANVGYLTINGELQGQNVSNNGISWGIRANNSISLTETTTLQINGRYNGPRISAQGKNKGVFMSDIGLRQDFLKKQLTVTLRVRDVLNTMEFISYSESDNFYQESAHKPKSLVGFINVSYKFGNMQVREPRKRQNGDNGYQESDEMMDMY